MKTYIDNGKLKGGRLSPHRAELLSYRNDGISYDEISKRLELKTGIDYDSGSIKGFVNRISRIKNPGQTLASQKSNIKEMHKSGRSSEYMAQHFGKKISKKVTAIQIQLFIERNITNKPISDAVNKPVYNLFLSSAWTKQGLQELAA